MISDLIFSCKYNLVEGDKLFCNCYQWLMMLFNGSAINSIEDDI